MEFLHNDKETFCHAINLVTSKNGLSTEIVEKDYYVTMILKLLSERLPFIVFKGGTSLSKCHKAIKRFSEDIDLTIDTTISQGQKRKVKECIEEVSSVLRLTILNIEETRSRRDYNQYQIAYKPVQDIIDADVPPTVILETSYTAVSFPVSKLPVHNYIGDMMIEEAPDYMERYSLSPFTMKVQDINRTLVDKVFALCDYYLLNKIERHSRHLYDIYKLLPLVPQDDSFKKLVNEVREVRVHSLACPSAKPDVDVVELLNKIISEKIYKSDYENLTEKILSENLKYDTVIQAIKQISKNGMFKKQ